METTRLHIPPGLRSRMRYPKFAGANTRMLVLESHYWLDGACCRAAIDLGWQVAKAPVVMEGKLPRGHLDQLLRTILECRPDFVLSINLSGMDEMGLLAEILAEWQLPHLTWFVDNPRTILMNRTCYGNDFAGALTWERAYVPYLRQAGFATVCHMPLAADRTVYDAAPALEATAPPAFVGNSMVGFAAREAGWLAQHPALDRAVHAALDAQDFGAARFGEGLDALLPADLVPHLDADQARHAELYLFIEGTRRKRAQLMRRICDSGVEVYGDPDWATVIPGARPELPYAELAAFYPGRRINLNSTSIQMPTAVNQRVFDVPAAGGFLLTDHQEDLLHLFDVDSELALFNSPDECAEQIERFERDVRPRALIAHAAQRRVLQEHTYHERLHAIRQIACETWS